MRLNAGLFLLESENEENFPDVGKNETDIVAVPEEKEKFPISGKSTVDEFLKSINFRMSGKLPELEQRAECWRANFEDNERIDDYYHYGERYDYTRLEIALYYSLQDLKSNFIRIGQILYMLRESPNPFCTNMEYSASRFGLSKTTAYALVGIYERFATPDGQLKPQYENMSFSHLAEWLSFSDEEIERYKGSCSTVAEIRALKKSLRDLKAIEVAADASESESVEASETIDIKEVEQIEEISEPKEVEPHEPQDISGTVYIHFANLEELRDWYFSDKRKNASFPLTVSYHVNSNSEDKE